MQQKQIKEKRGKEVCNPQGSCQNPKHPWLSTIPYIYCLYVLYLLGNSLMRKRGLVLMVRYEPNCVFVKSVLAKILRSHAYVPSKRELRDQSDRSSS